MLTLMRRASKKAAKEDSGSKKPVPRSPLLPKKTAAAGEEDDAPILAKVALDSVPVAPLHKYDYDPLGGRFRQINSMMYAMTSDQMAEQFSKGIDLISAYHAGYERQMKKWPKHPLDAIIPWLDKHVVRWESLSARQKKAVPSSHGKKNRPVIIDFGAGSCRVAKELALTNSDADPCVVISVDFAPAVSTGLPPQRTSGRELLSKGGFWAGSMTKLSHLPDECADAGVFSLSLMGRDWPFFIKEASRLLKRDGYLAVAEVNSRIINFKRFGEVLEAGGHFTLLGPRISLGNYFSIYYLRKTKSGAAAAKNIDGRQLRVPLLNAEKPNKAGMRGLSPNSVDPGAQSNMKKGRKGGSTPGPRQRSGEKQEISNRTVKRASRPRKGSYLLKKRPAAPAAGTTDKKPAVRGSEITEKDKEAAKKVLKQKKKERAKEIAAMRRARKGKA